jgi:hypothetical protein
MSDHRLGIDLHVSASTAVFDTALPTASVAARQRVRLAELVRVVEQKAVDGQATADDARRYRMARLAQSLLRSPGRLPHVPRAVDRILATRQALAVELIVGPEVPGPAVAQ